MAFETITAEEIDAKSPITDQLMDKYLDRDQYLKDTLTDGATAPQDIVGKKIQSASTDADSLSTLGGLDVAGDGQIDGNLNVTGGITAGNFTVPDTALLFFGF